MREPSDEERLNDLDARISAAKGDVKAKAELSDRGNSAGYDFAGSVIGSIIAGYIIDRIFDTSPWALLVMAVVGFVIGIYMSWRSSSRDNVE